MWVNVYIYICDQSVDVSMTYGTIVPQITFDNRFQKGIHLFIVRTNASTTDYNAIVYIRKIEKKTNKQFVFARNMRNECWERLPLEMEENFIEIVIFIAFVIPI